MEELINLLHTGGYSCVIANEGKIRTFTQRGVADLYDLLTREPEFLKGDVVSSNAMDLFRTSDVKVDFVQEVPFIWNRDHTGWCPVETMCSEEESAEAILQLIRGFLERIKNKE